jgi:two-component system cell cycle sensor histidine kinase PleC
MTWVGRHGDEKARAKNMMDTILVVDDEPQVLAAIADTLEDDFNVLVDVSPLSAIEMLRQTKGLSVIISDQRMPGLSGHEFLSQAREVSDATRILITGYSDMDAVIAAVNSGRIFGYISKPWEPEKLRSLIRQAAEHCELLRALTEEQRLLNNLMDSVPDAIYFKDRGRRYLRGNRAHARALGLDDPALMIGKRAGDFVPPHQARLFEIADDQILATDASHADTLVKLQAEGEPPQWLSTTRAPIRDEEGRVTGLVAIARDVTARQLAAEELREAHDLLERRVAERTAELSATAEQLVVARVAAEAASQAKSQFLATMSHELRTPLTGLIGFPELLLRKNSDPDELRRFLELQRDAGRTLLALVNDILDISKIEAGKLELELLPFEPREIFAGCQALVAHGAEAKGLKLSTEMDAAMPAWLLGDPMRLRQITLNLLSNAVKFTDTGSVVLAARWLEATPGWTELRVTVTDTGIGIPSDRLGRLFQEFSQVDDSTSRRFGGSGLGLAICRRLVELMGGRIGVDNTADRGSMFWFEIPATIAPPVATASVTDDTADATSTGTAMRRILLAEDSTPIQILISSVLQAAGHDVQIVDNGAAAVSAAAAGSYDLILMDVQMPILDGLAATQQIRASETDGRHIPIVALTANATSGEVERCRLAGMDVFLSKPVDLDLLLATVQRPKLAPDPA